MADFTDKTFKETYRDYYNPEDGYHRVLFNGGRALQARELIESQTIIQEEIARFGRNIFKEGALVNAGGATVNNKMEYIRLSPNSVFEPLVIGSTLTNGSIEFKVIEAYPATNEDPATLYVQYTNTTGATDSTVSPRVSAGDELSVVSSPSLVAVDMFVAADGDVAAAGRGTKAHFHSGDFFVQGHFVYMAGGSVFIDKYSDKPTVDFGFGIEQSIITENEDSQLFDNQGEVVDRTAPGAHRFKIALTPTTRAQAGDDFVFVARIVEGIVTREVGTFDAYNTINDLLAQRTKEESGDYVVEGFTAIPEDKDSFNLNLDVTEGIAYVDGYRLEIGTEDIRLPKARDTITKTNDSVPAIYGNWVYADLEADSSEGLPRIDTFGYVQLKSGTIGSSAPTIGFANVRGVQKDSVGYRVYLFNIRMNTGHAFSEVSFIKDPLTQYEMPLQATSGNALYGTADNSLLFPLPSGAPKPLQGQTITYTGQRYHQVTADNNGEITLPGLEYSQWVVAEVDGPVLPIVLNSGTISGLTAGTLHTVLTYETIDAAPKSKNLITSVVDQSLPSVDWEKRPVNLGVVDGVEIISVKVRTASTTDWADADDITFQFTMDGGQRDNFYDIAKAYIKSGYVMPTGAEAEVRVEFSHYERTAGKYFSASSYPTYEEIPDHTYASGETISLRDVIDFRPDRVDSFTNEFSVTELPQNASSITIPNVEYYLPRIDLLVAKATDGFGNVGFGALELILGEPSEYPTEPEIPNGSLALHKISMKPYTFSTSDVTVTTIPNKRFTMKDLGRLERRVSNLFELTTLSLLEVNTNTLNVLDENGNARTKAGFIADNFRDFSFSDIEDEEYRAALDGNGNLRASFRNNSVRLTYTQGGSKNGDLVTLPISAHVPHVSQLLATDTENVNPFAVITQQGHLTLSPSSDEWVETRTLPAPVQTFFLPWDDLWINVGEQSPTQMRRTNELMQGREVEGNFQTFQLPQTLLGQQVAGETVIPFMRSRRINFSAKGLRPNANMYAFFGNVDVNAWVRQVSSPTLFSDNSTEVGSAFANATGHPDGATALVTDDKGELHGEFFLPNTDALQFRTGSQEFVLMDVSSGNRDDALTVTSAFYESSGSVQTRFRPPFRQLDPLAQSFVVDQAENPNGIFITRANVFMSSKDDTIPLQVQIRRMENGYPTATPIRNASKFIDPANVVVTPFNETTDIEDVKNAPTVVEFDEPVYLQAGAEYAIVLLAESTEYNAYIAKTYDYVIGPSRDTIVSRQPTLGSLFLSQNGSTWSADQTRDMMFELERAEFDTSGTVVLENAPLPRVTLSANPFEATSGSTLMFVNHEGHGFTHDDTVVISGATGGAGGVSATELNGTHLVKSPEWGGYYIETTAAAGTGNGGGAAVIATQQVMINQYVPQISNVLPTSTRMSAFITTASGSSFGTNRSSMQNAYTTKTTPAMLNTLNVTDTPRIVASPENAGGMTTLSMSLNLSTTDTKVSPVVDLQRSSVLALEYIIGNGDEAQHITTPITIDESSVALKVIFAANRPSGAEFEVYMRSAVDEDALFAVDDNGDPVVDWVQGEIDTAMPSDDNASTFRDYEYTIETDSFSVFQVKIVMKSNNSSKSPRIRDLRAIALVV